MATRSWWFIKIVSLGCKSEPFRILEVGFGRSPRHESVWNSDTLKRRYYRCDCPDQGKHTLLLIPAGSQTRTDTLALPQAQLLNGFNWSTDGKLLLSDSASLVRRTPMATTEPRSSPKPVLASRPRVARAIWYFPGCFAMAATLHISGERMRMDAIRCNSPTGSEIILLFVQQI